jgi:hypothetical protein
VQRRRERQQLAVASDLDFFMRRSVDPQLFGTEDFERMLPPGMSEQRLRIELRHIPGTDWRCEIRRQPAAVKSCSCSEVDALDEVLVVTDEQKRRSRDDARSVALDPDRDLFLPAQHLDGGENECDPFCATTLSQPLARLHDARIETDRRVVEENAVADAPDVNPLDMTTRNHLHGFVEIERNVEVLRKVIEGPQRQHTQGCGTPCEHRGHRVQRTVTSARDDCVRMAIKRITRGGRDAAIRIHLGHRDVHPVSRKQLFNVRTNAGVAWGSASPVQQDGEHRTKTLAVMASHRMIRHERVGKGSASPLVDPPDAIVRPERRQLAAAKPGTHAYAGVVQGHIVAGHQSEERRAGYG